VGRETAAMRWSVANLLLAFVLCCGAKAEDAGQGYGVGMKSCAQFVKDYAVNPAGAEELYFLWAEGFMSALNLSFATNTGVYKDFSRGDATSYKLRIRSYCEAHPQKQYVGAVMDLLNSLPVK
jgi:hypothetical protein